MQPLPKRRKSAPDTSCSTADGHVLEDVQGIMAKMPSKWGEAMRGRFENPMSKLHGMTILPWLGYLSTIPTGGSGTAISRKGPMEHGENPESWEYFLEAVGIERTVLYPTLGLTIGRVRDLEYVKVVTRAPGTTGSGRPTSNTPQAGSRRLRCCRCKYPRLPSKS